MEAEHDPFYGDDDDDGSEVAEEHADCDFGKPKSPVCCGRAFTNASGGPMELSLADFGIKGILAPSNGEVSKEGGEVWRELFGSEPDDDD